MRAEVAYAFGDEEVVVAVSLEGGRCTVAARVAKSASGGAYELALLLALRPGESVHIDGAAEKINPTVLIHTNGGPRTARSLRWRELTWTLPEGSLVDYPVVPHNSYTQDGLPAPEDYVGRISFALTRESKEISIS